MSAPCVFCRITRGELPAEVVSWKPAPAVVGFKSAEPLAPTHVIFAPLEHVEGLDVLPTRCDLLEIVTRWAVVWARDNLPGGFRLVVNTGVDAGQTVRHLHVHVLGGAKLPDLAGCK